MPCIRFRRICSITTIQEVKSIEKGYSERTQFNWEEWDDYIFETCSDRLHFRSVACGNYEDCEEGDGK
ncbi:hypothetical protein ACFPFV_08745 [Salinicoccus siamensis]|uniref:hypothetical protein n=1 Tax=Salinicoccus siamensis TaxID=381830 RepID=UPI00361B8B94